jgi:organic hydroperoxide reductase OsmC/OhrA
MSYTVTVSWQRASDEPFVDSKYSRGHLLKFDGGIEIPGSSSPHVIPLPLSVEGAVDPEEAFVASLSSCHMLWFLSIAAEKGLIVESYQDNAEGILGKNDEGKLAMTKVTLRPKSVFGGDNAVTDEQITEIHHEAHEKCFIANSVKTNVVTEPVWDIG